MILFDGSIPQVVLLLFRQVEELQEFSVSRLYFTHLITFPNFQAEETLFYAEAGEVSDLSSS